VQLRPYFHRTEFLEKNSRKSGWKAPHKQSGKVAYAGTPKRGVLTGVLYSQDPKLRAAPRGTFGIANGIVKWNHAL
jgi:hypothetical protein